MIIPYFERRVFNILFVFFLLLLNLVVLNRSLAQCTQTNDAMVGDIQGYHLSSSEAEGAANFFWTVNIGEIQGSRTNRDVTILWTGSGQTNVIVTYTKGTSQMTKCWAVFIHPELSPGSITTSITSVGNNEIFSYDQLLNASLATGGINEYKVDAYRYQWEESIDNINWTDIIGATAPNCTGSTMIASKMYFRREAYDGRTTKYSNVLSIDITSSLKPGRVSSSQIIAPNTTPSLFAVVIAPSGGTGTYSFQWETSSDEMNWIAITGATAATYQPGSITRTGYYRRKVSSGNQSVYTNTLQLLVKDNTILNKPITGVPSSSAPKESIPAYTGLSPDVLTAVTSYNIYKPGVSDVSQLPGLEASKDYFKSTAYLDGLNRPIQNIDYKANVSGKDVASVAVYDQYGRETVRHLPYVAPTDATNAGKFRLDATTQQPQFFNALTGNQEDYFYSSNLQESSPISRAAKGTLPGKSYTGSSIGDKQMARMNYDADNVRIWTIGNTSSDMPVSNGMYTSGTLTVRVSTSSDGARVYEFTDLEGKVVMKSVQLDADKEGEGLRSYYVYDDLRNLRCIISPLAVKYCVSTGTWDFAASATATGVLKELCYRYFYDEKGRIVSQELPGTNGPIYIVYDTRDRIVFAQDPVMRSRGLGEWRLYLYDGLDRLSVAAIYKNTTATRESLQADMNVERPATNVSFTNPPVADLYVDESTPQKIKYEATNSVTLLPGFDSGSGVDCAIEVNSNAAGEVENIMVSNPAPGISGFEPFKIYYYDNYDWPGTKKFSSNYMVDAGTNPYADPIAAANIVSGRITGSKIKIAGQGKWLTNTAYYDIKGRKIQQLTENVSGGTDIFTTQYDFADKILSTFQVLKNPMSKSDPETRIQTRYEYNSGSWLSKVYHTLFNGSTAQTTLLSMLTYDETGKIKTKTLGTLETLIYDYNLQGQLTGINAEYARNKSTSHYFGMELFYDKGFAAPQVDGNISGVTWRRKGNPDEWHAYGYSFDNADRLTKADYVQNTSGTWTNDAADYKVSIPAYDENGNIRQMKQDGMLLGNVKATIDDLSYKYENSDWSNRLDGVTDPQGDKGQRDFKNYSGRTGTDDYNYDVNGNLTKDKNKGVTVINNFLLNKPEKINLDNDPNKSVTFVYSMDGAILQRIVKNGVTADTYTYINGFVYKNDELLFFPHSDGRVRKNSNGQLVYDYMIRDYLGNTRVVVTDETSQVYYKATHEDNPQPQPSLPEREMFTFPANVDVIPTANKFYDYAGTNRKFVKLNNNDPDRKIGTAKVLRVMAGDVAEIGVMSYYPVNSAVNNTPNQPAELIVGQLINLLLGPYSTIPNGKNNILQSNGNGLILNKDDFSMYVSNTQNSNPPSTVPRAYLNYVLFDDNFKMVMGGVVRVSQPDVITPLASSLNISKNGYLYVYISNESPTDVYFDDLVVKHTTGHLLQEDSYYPFGLQIKSLSSQALSRQGNNYLYNNIEKIEDFDLDVYNALYRNLDPQIGRWWQMDPLAEKYAGISPYNSNFNNPICFSDPFGDEPGDDEIMKKLLAEKQNVLRTVVIVGQRIQARTAEINIHFVANGFNEIPLRMIRLNKVARPISDNLRSFNLTPLPTAQKSENPWASIPIEIKEQPIIKPTDDCYICPELNRQAAYEKDVTRKMFETEQGASFLTVKSAVDAAAWEFASFKVAQGATYLGLGFWGRQAGRGVDIPAGALKFTKEEAAAAEGLGFLAEDVSVSNGVADIPIILMTEVKPSYITTVSSALRRVGVRSIKVNSGPIINPYIKGRLESVVEAGKEFLGFKVTRTGSPENMFILIKDL